MVKLTPTGVKINTILVWTSHNTGGVELYTGVFAVCLRGHNWLHFAHRLECTVTLNSNFAILKPGGALNFGLRAMCHQKDPTFFRSLSPKDPHFYQLSPNDPLFFENFDIFDEMLRNFCHFGPESPYF